MGYQDLEAEMCRVYDEGVKAYIEGLAKADNPYSIENHASLERAFFNEWADGWQEAIDYRNPIQ